MSDAGTIIALGKAEYDSGCDSICERSWDIKNARNDVLQELANLSKALEGSALSPIEAHQLCVSKVRKLEAQYLGNNTFWNDKA